MAVAEAEEVDVAGGTEDARGTLDDDDVAGGGGGGGGGSSSSVGLRSWEISTLPTEARRSGGQTLGRAGHRRL